MSVFISGIMSKIITPTSTGYKFAFKSFQSPKSVTYSGNIPYVPSGTVMNLILNEHGDVVDYKISLSPRNVTLFKKNLGDEENPFDILTFEQKMDLHKKTGFLWRNLKKAENPYDSFPFAKADSIYKETVNDPKGQERLDAINQTVVNTFRKSRKDTYSFSDYIDCFRSVEKEGAFAPLKTPYMMKTFCEDSRFILDCSEGVPMVKDAELINADRLIKSSIHKKFVNKKTLLKDEVISKYIDSCNNDYNFEQMDSIYTLSSTQPAVITGGAGVGKTTVIEGLADCYCQTHSVESVCLLAPTGRASRRISEKTSYEAFTIHHALRKNPEDEYVYYNQHNKLPQKLFIIDESSMIDTLLMNDLLNAVSDDAKLIFVGDANQLEPVGCGSPFFDFCKCKDCAVYTLIQNYRQEDDNVILENADHALSGKYFVEGNGFSIERISKDEICHYIDEEVQCISPYNAINDYINDCVAKKYTDRPHLYGFYEGAKVIATRNTKDYCNGDIGTILYVEKNGITINFGYRTVKVEISEIKDIRLANAITVHKMQGSECEKVIIFIPAKKTPFITPNLLYTAFTRARKSVRLYYYY